jgi:flagellar biosynthesis protein FlhA
MDGASKYVRGDAIAGILVIVINIVGGLIVGMVQHDMAFADAVANYTLLAIGDGLVAQIPSLIISVAAGVVVSRVANNEDIGGQIITQLFSNPNVIYITAGIIGGIGIIPGMPHFAFIVLASILASIAYMVAQNKTKAITQAEMVEEDITQVVTEVEEASWDDVVPVDIIGLEVGYRLIPLVDKGQGGDLLKRIKGIRKKFAQEVGFLAPTVHIRDNLELRPNHYRITLKGVEIASGESNFAQFLAIDPGTVTGELDGAVTTDPAFGLPAVWVDSNTKEQAQVLGYTVVDAGTVIATHLNHMISMHAAELLGREEVQKLLDHVAKESPKMIEELVPKLISVAVIQKVLQNLLIEGVHIRDMRTILETLSENVLDTKDANDLTALVRIKLGRAIVQDLFPVGNEVTAMTLDNKLESILLQAVQSNNSAIEPGIAETLSQQAEVLSKQHEQMGLTPVLLVPAPLRVALSKFLRRSVPHLRVLSHEELPDSKTIRVTSLIGGQA